MCIWGRRGWPNGPNKACSDPKSITESTLRALFHHGRGALPKTGKWARACLDQKRAFRLTSLITDANASGHPPKIRKPGPAGEGQKGPSLLRPEKNILYEKSYHGR